MTVDAMILNLRKTLYVNHETLNIHVKVHVTIKGRQIFWKNHSQDNFWL